MAVSIKNDWDKILEPEFEKQYYLQLRRKLTEEYRTQKIFPSMYDIFNALRYSSYESTKAVILGQDPYHNDGQAHGLSFSVQKGTDIPPSLKNIYKELHSDLGIVIPGHGDLSSWAKQGVLLLNSILTVRAHKAASHKNIGWETFTDSIISLLNEREDPAVFVLWGAFAQSKSRFITNPAHLIISSPHPSPLSASRGFFGSRPFSRTNTFLQSCGRSPIDWSLPEDPSEEKV